MTTMVWLHRDLRLADHPALHYAAERSETLLPVFIWAPEEEDDWPPGSAHQWWLHHSLTALDADLRSEGLQLTLRTGPSLPTLRALAEETGADAIVWNTRYEPALRERDDEIAEVLRKEGIVVHTFASRILHEPDAIQTTSGGPYHVYTPFWRTFQAEVSVDEPLPRPRLSRTLAPTAWPDGLSLDALKLTPYQQDGVDWASGLRDAWTPGEQAAHERLQHFIDHLLIDYEKQRDRPDLDGTSRLSPYLHHGELSPRQVWHAVQNKPMNQAATAYLRQLVWREFSYHLLHHYPETPTVALKGKFDAFGWRDDDALLERWQQGQTGFPIVDAGMRQLWNTGWMHNRVRMIVASFLTKDLLIRWQRGAEWFWDTLVDGDLANNTMGWQWSAGCGADAQPFFRVFNPVTQGERHDPDGAYVRRYVPELSKLPNRYLHKPWTAPADVLNRAGIKRGHTYPEPVVNHHDARDRALAAHQKIKRT